MICFRDRTYCSAFCATADCSRRWTAELQTAANAWMKDPPVAFINFAPICLIYRQPDPEQDHRTLAPGEANP